MNDQETKKALENEGIYPIHENTKTELTDTMLDNDFGAFQVQGMWFTSSQILKNCDPTAYAELVTDYMDTSDFTWVDNELYYTDAVERIHEQNS